MATKVMAAMKTSTLADQNYEDPRGTRSEGRRGREQLLESEDSRSGFEGVSKTVDEPAGIAEPTPARDPTVDCRKRHH
jgi:hypothetical protein